MSDKNTILLYTKLFIVEHGIVNLRSITAEDIARIKKWPVYLDGFEQMDYALREHGWLDEYWNKPKLGYLSPKQTSGL